MARGGPIRAAKAVATGTLHCHGTPRTVAALKSTRGSHGMHSISRDRYVSVGWLGWQAARRAAERPPLPRHVYPLPACRDRVTLAGHRVRLPVPVSPAPAQDVHGRANDDRVASQPPLLPDPVTIVVIGKDEADALDFTRWVCRSRSDPDGRRLQPGFDAARTHMRWRGVRVPVTVRLAGVHAV